MTDHRGGYEQWVVNPPIADKQTLCGSRGGETRVKVYLSDIFALQGKVAALTGAGGFLVSEISRGLANAGVKVALLDRDIEAAEKVAGSIRK